MCTDCSTVLTPFDDYLLDGCLISAGTQCHAGVRFNLIRHISSILCNAFYVCFVQPHGNHHITLYYLLTFMFHVNLDVAVITGFPP